MLRILLRFFLDYTYILRCLFVVIVIESLVYIRLSKHLPKKPIALTFFVWMLYLGFFEPLLLWIWEETFGSVRDMLFLQRQHICTIQ